MIPQLMVVRVKYPDGRPISLWIPVIPMLIVLAPLLVLGAVAACLKYRVDIGRAFAYGWGFLAALRGTHVDVKQGGHTSVLVSID
jgi:hypothetical protein